MRFDAMECGKRIKALREEKRLTQMELAEQICITTDHLRAIICGLLNAGGELVPSTCWWICLYFLK